MDVMKLKKRSENLSKDLSAGQSMELQVSEERGPALSSQWAGFKGYNTTTI